MNQEDFEKSVSGMDLTPMTPHCIGITYYNRETQNAYVAWIKRQLEDVNRNTPPYCEIDGRRFYGIIETLEKTIPYLR